MIKRRLYVEERESRMARWSFRLALFSVPVIILAAALYRFGALDFRPALVTLGAGLGLAVLGAVLAVCACVSVWESGWRGMGRSIGALAIAVGVVAGPAAVLARGAMLPPLTDISTDAVDPPHFRALGIARPRTANPTTYPGESAAALQREAYPGIKPVDLDATPDEAFNAVLALVQKRKWRVLDAIPPRGGLRDGQIEAVAPTPLLGFRNDVVIRVRATPKGGSRVDVRSSSRYGIHDLGENAMRITSLMADLAAERRKH
ncbi:hypothetical protein GCM10007301_48690 [Azorhizobium oxalatiphilum]|uniref:DUF1499 domain-containing protein n=1 Tax=Azorhizobium oxalatiphilum TaxID=980631 RepID=A0A917FGD8_9HYPH|nr:DUF1499 domain-containing protein [Azorhizobium oxalatiphilum]GGF82820.1 hypothetical protein GCM10007301_48690 [Azorhizobium oxalatiphilum]